MQLLIAYIKNVYQNYFDMEKVIYIFFKITEKNNFLKSKNLAKWWRKKYKKNNFL